MKPKATRISEAVDPLRSTAVSAQRISRSQSLSQEHDCVYGMSDCFRKLQGMVPNVPSNKRLSRVEILQHVIDYIQDLQYELQANPTAQEGTETNQGAERIPLSAISFNKLTDKV